MGLDPARGIISAEMQSLTTSTSVSLVYLSNLTAYSCDDAAGCQKATVGSTLVASDGNDCGTTFHAALMEMSIVPALLRLL